MSSYSYPMFLTAALLLTTATSLAVVPPAHPSTLCEEPRQGYGERPLLTDCNAAIRQFPTYPNSQGTFHYNDPIDAFRLPDERVVGTCMVVVGLWDGVSDEGTWPAVKTAALGLSETCKGKGSWARGGRMKTGGHMRTGGGNHIGIDLFRAPARRQLGNNHTVAAGGVLGTQVTETS